MTTSHGAREPSIADRKWLDVTLAVDTEEPLFASRRLGCFATCAALRAGATVRDLRRAGARAVACRDGAGTTHAFYVFAIDLAARLADVCKRWPGTNPDFFARYGLAEKAFSVVARVYGFVLARLSFSSVGNAHAVDACAIVARGVTWVPHAGGWRGYGTHLIDAREAGCTQLVFLGVTGRAQRPILIGGADPKVTLLRILAIRVFFANAVAGLAHRGHGEAYTTRPSFLFYAFPACALDAGDTRAPGRCSPLWLITSRWKIFAITFFQGTGTGTDVVGCKTTVWKIEEPRAIGSRHRDTAWRALFSAPRVTTTGYDGVRVARFGWRSLVVVVTTSTAAPPGGEGGEKSNRKNPCRDESLEIHIRLLTPHPYRCNGLHSGVNPCWFSGVGVGGSFGSPRRGRAGRPF
jgi:hypothetical protein